MLGAGFAEGDLGQGAAHTVPEGGTFEELTVVWELEMETPGSAKSQWVSEASVRILDLSPRRWGASDMLGARADDRRVQSKLDGARAMAQASDGDWLPARAAGRQAMEELRAGLSDLLG